MTPMPSEQDSYARWDAAYVLGSLSSAQRHEFENHLVSCVACRTAVAELSGVPSLLALLRPEELPTGGSGHAAVARIHPAGAPRPQLLEDLVAEVARRRRHSRRLTFTAAGLAAAGLAAAAFLVLGGLIAWRPAPSAPPDNPVASAMTMEPVVPSPMTATVALTSRDWGTDIDMTCTYRMDVGGRGDADASGDQFALVAVGHDGSRTELASWVEHDGATALPTASTALHVDEIASLEVISRHTKQILLRREL